MDMNVFRGLITLVLLILFVGLWAWTFSNKRRTEYDAAAKLPLEEGDQPPARDRQESLP